MPVTTLLDREIHVDDEGFLTEYDEWDEKLAAELAKNIGVEMTEEHWKVVKFLRDDYKGQGSTATTRRVDAVGGFPVKLQFQLFPQKPAKKMAYIAGLPKPAGCV